MECANGYRACVGRCSCTSSERRLSLRALCLAGRASRSRGSTYTVASRSDAAAQSCSYTTCQSLRAAIAQANVNPGSTIELGPGAYALDLGGLTITAPTTLQGAGAEQTTIEQTTQGAPVLTIQGNSGDVSLGGLTVTGGNVAGAGTVEGGGISASGSGTLSLTTTSSRKHAERRKLGIRRRVSTRTCPSHLTTP